MNSLVVYYSKFGNTQKVAEAIGEVLEATGTVRVIDSGKLDESGLKGVNLVVMGTPTHRMNLPEEVKAAFGTLPRRILKRVPVAAFDTSYKMSWWLSRLTASRKLIRKLRKLGGRRIVLPETFYVIARDGPLYDGEMDRAKVWATLILKRVEDHAH